MTDTHIDPAPTAPDEQLVTDAADPTATDPPSSESVGLEAARSETNVVEARTAEEHDDDGNDESDESDGSDERDGLGEADAPDGSDLVGDPELEREEDADGDEGDDDEAGQEDGQAGTTGRRRGGRVAQLEREGEVAADFLETLLDIADLDGDIEVDIDGDRAAVSVVDSDEGRVPRRLVGQQGKVLEALQELTRLAVQTATGERSRLMLDVAGHRAERRTTLVALAQVVIAQVKESGQRKALDDMTAFERKVVHDEVAAAGLDSESEGVEPHRHIVIIPA